MRFNRPTLEELIDRGQGDIESRLPGSDPRLRRNLLNIVAEMHAGAVHGSYGYIDWLARQLMPDTAEDEWLERHADRRGMALQDAKSAQGNVDFSGNDGVDIPAGSQVQTSDGVVYATDAQVTINGGAATAAVTAVEAGSAGNQVAGVKLTLVTPISGINSQATVAAAGITGGADKESHDSLRARLLQRIRNPESGGNLQDYISWALAAHQDVTDVWPVPNAQGAGTITIRLMTYGATANGIPTQTVLDAVHDYVVDRMPVPNGGLFVIAPTAVPLDLTLTSLNPNTVDVQNAISASAQDFMRRTAEPGGTVLLSQLDESISLAAGEISHTLSSPAGDVTHTAGQIPVLGNITWP